MTDATQKLANSGPATTHPDYAKCFAKWQRVRVCHKGSDEVKAMRETYLPCPGGMEPDDYGMYLLRANFLPAVQRTEEVLSGLLFRDPPDVDAPPGLDEFIADVTMTGQTLDGFAQDTILEALVTGRFGVVLDFSTDESGANLRPYWCLRKAEDIVNWRAVRLAGGETALTRLFLREDVLVDGKEEYELAVDRRIREYRLTPEGVVVDIHAIRKDEWEVIETIYPKILDKPLDRIPAIVASARAVGVGNMVTPPLLSIADLSLSHYRSSADLEQGNFYASLPMPYVIGAKLPKGQPGPRQAGQAYEPDSQPKDTGYKMGSGKVMNFPKGPVEVGYLEIKGPGLASLHKTLEMKEKQLMSVGARLIADQTRSQAETAQTARIRGQADASLLRLAANTIDQVLTKALATVAGWMGVEGDVSVILNRDYLGEKSQEEEKKADPMDIDNWPLE